MTTLFMPLLKRLAARLPNGAHKLRRLFFRSQIRRRRFYTDERELVGPEGRVVAVEPVLDPFALLSENVRHFGQRQSHLPSVRVVKIDAEGHELSVLKGMRKLLVRDQPALIVETSATKTGAWLAGCGYLVQRLPDSSNLLCTQHQARSAA